MRFFSFFLIAALLIPQAALARTPSDPHAAQWGYTLLDTEAAWEVTQGSRDIVVAVIDNGFDTFHPDLYPNVWQNEDEIAGNGVDDDLNGYIDDRYGWDFHVDSEDRTVSGTEVVARGDNDPRPDVLRLFALEETVRDHIHHATIVAGIIGAVGDNAQDGAGINWQVKLMNLKITDANSGRGNPETIVDAVYYAVDNGADIINFSVVGPTSEEITEAITYAYEHGVAMVAASGNEWRDLDQSPQHPICADIGDPIEKILGVSAVQEGRFFASFSNIGSCIDITAPGVNISSTVRYAPNHGLTERYRGGWQGTSFGAPYVSGVLALIKSIHPGWGPDELYDIAISSVSRTPPEDPVAYEQLFGAGLVQAGAAVEEAYRRKALLGPTVTSLQLQSADTAVVLNPLQLVESSALISLPSELPPKDAVTVDGQSYAINVNSVVPEIMSTNDAGVEHAISVPMLTSLDSIRAADVNGDGHSELTLIGKNGQQSMMVTMSQSGQLYRAVILGGGAYSLAVADRDGDGADELYSYPSVGAGKVFAWSDGGRKITSWQVPASDSPRTFVVSYADGSRVIY